MQFKKERNLGKVRVASVIVALVVLILVAVTGASAKTPGAKQGAATLVPKSYSSWMELVLEKDPGYETRVREFCQEP